MKQKSRLFYLALSVCMPPIGIMLLAAVDLVYSHENMETLARSYVENFTEIMVARVERGGDSFLRGLGVTSGDGKHFSGLHTYMTLGRIPGSVLVMGSDGAFLYGSSSLMDLIETNGGRLPVGIAKSLYSDSGERFTVCAYPAFFGKYTVVGAISWHDVPQSTVRFYNIWPYLAGFMGIWGAVSIWKLWKLVLKPLEKLEQEMSTLKWGEELPPESGEDAFFELRKLRSSFTRVAQDAVNRVSIIKTCMNDMVSVAESERTKISRDIHDGPLQDVTALIQRIHLAKLPDNKPEDTARELDLAEKIAMATVREMRGLCDFLNPPWLELGLQQALTELTERQALQYGVQIFLDIDEEAEFSESITLSFFRVVQEAVTNSVRHGEAKNIWVDVRRDEKGYELVIQDDGHGFDTYKSGTAELRVEGHRGLSNMEERMEIVGGRLKVISYPGEGTCIRGLIP
ncbi:MAG: sensor histidine kinase [Synergistaceae bacterium]|nr:sensor histidine kinase [Synergistaceae bacterium]